MPSTARHLANGGPVAVADLHVGDTCEVALQGENFHGTVADVAPDGTWVVVARNGNCNRKILPRDHQATFYKLD